jgi:hypothetical protein
MYFDALSTLSVDKEHGRQELPPWLTPKCGGSRKADDPEDAKSVVLGILRPNRGPHPDLTGLCRRQKNKTARGRVDVRCPSPRSSRKQRVIAVTEPAAASAGSGDKT